MKGNIALARSAAALLALLAVFLPPRHASAQSTGKTTRLIVPFPAGGTADVLMRLVGQQLSQISGQPVLVENRPGASTVIATDFVARSAPDGATLLVIADSFVINPTVRASLPYRPFAFEPVCLLVNSPQVLVVNADSPYKSLADFVTAAKARPGELNYAAVGPATTQHIAGEMFKRAAEINLTFVPYAGGAPAVHAILGGHVTAVLTNYNEVMTQINSGKLRPLAVTSHKRLSAMPDVPTMIESGYKDVEATAWFGVMAPPKTPQETMGQLIALFRSALAVPELQSKLTAQGLFLARGCGADFAAHLDRQHENFARAIAEAGLMAE